jgi:Flp pilus assembly protein TadD
VATAAPDRETVAVPVAPKRDPKRAKVLFDQAEAKRRNMDTSGAIALYLRAEQADPGLAEIHKKLGQCYQLEGDIPRARDRYRKYLATGPPDADKIKASLEMLR